MTIDLDLSHWSKSGRRIGLDNERAFVLAYEDGAFHIEKIGDLSYRKLSKTCEGKPHE